MTINLTLLVFLVVSFYTDIRYRKVYNFATLPAIILGLCFNFFYSGFPGLKNSLVGLTAGFLFLFIFYLMGGMSAGDVKFMTAVGALKGLNFVVLGGFYGAALGGIAAVIILLGKKRLMPTLKRLFFGLMSLLTFKTPESIKFDGAETVYLPYTAFLSLGMLLELFLNFK